MKTSDILEAIKAFSIQHFKENLVGIYIHGSYAMGSFNEAYSDLDLLVVVRESLSFQTKRDFADEWINLTTIGPRKGFEISVILETHVKAIKHPVAYELHFSNAHIERYQKDKTYICGGGEDPDLVAHLKVTKERGIAMYGQPIETLIGEVSDEDFIDSILNDLKDITLVKEEDQTYYLLNQLRFKYYLTDRKIYSKVEGGKRALNEYAGLEKFIIENALSSYEPVAYKQRRLLEADVVNFSQKLMTEIEQMIKMG